MSHDLTIGRFFFRAYRTQGRGMKFTLHRNGFSLWCGRLMFEAHLTD